MHKSVHEYVQRVKRLSRILFYFLAATVLGIGFTPYSAFFAGMTVGLTVGFINTIHTAHKTNKIGQAAISGNRRSHLGMLTRIALVSLGAVIVLYFPEHFDVLGFVIGLLVVPLFVLGDALYMHMREGK